MTVCFIDGTLYIPGREISDALRDIASSYRELDNPDAARAVEYIAVGIDLALIDAATQRAEREAAR